MPHAVADSNPTIIGAGPVGCVAALLLHQHNIPVTLIDVTPRNLQFQVNRAYSFGVNSRGLEVLSHIPNILDQVETLGTKSFPLKRHSRQADGSWHLTIFGKFGTGQRVSRSIPRHTFVSLCRDEIDRSPSITCMYETDLQGIQVGADGELTLQLKSAFGEVKSMDTRLLLACDGIRSQCAKLLQDLTPVQSSNGLQRQAIRTYAPTLLAKILLVDENFYKSESTNDMDDSPYAPGEFMMYSFHNIHKSDMKDSLLIDIFPQSKQIIRKQGGVRAAIRASPESSIWDETNVESMFDLLEKKLPLFRAREFVSGESLKSFLSASPLRMPSVARRGSLSATVAKGEETSGVVFMGDAAHSFPPDVGEGLNAGLQDALVFVQTLLTIDVDTTCSQLVKRYEEVREAEITALIRFAQRSVVVTLPSRLDAIAFSVRTVLAKHFPNVFYAPAVQLRNSFDSYGEIMQKADETTRRLYIVAVLLGLLICLFIGFLVSFM